MWSAYFRPWCQTDSAKARRRKTGPAFTAQHHLRFTPSSPERSGGLDTVGRTSCCLPHPSARPLWRRVRDGCLQGCINLHLPATFTPTGVGYHEGGAGSGSFCCVTMPGLSGARQQLLEGIDAVDRATLGHRVSLHPPPCTDPGLGEDLHGEPPASHQSCVQTASPSWISLGSSWSSPVSFGLCFFLISRLIIHVSNDNSYIILFSKWVFVVQTSKVRWSSSNCGQKSWKKLDRSHTGWPDNRRWSLMLQ